MKVLLRPLLLIHSRHVGDLGNIEANEEGVAEFQVEDHLLSLSGTESIIGRALVVGIRSGCICSLGRVFHTKLFSVQQIQQSLVPQSKFVCRCLLLYRNFNYKSKDKINSITNSI